MAFDSNTRTKLARMIAQARQLLVEEFTQQFQEIYGIQPDGTITEVEKLKHLDDQQASTARLLRERIDHLVSGMTAEKKPVFAAIDRTIREQAFTVLNRFAALRMCEERSFVEECIREEMQSKGFKVYETVAGAGLGDTHERYKTFLFCLFDEIAVDLGVLFDRFSSYGLLFPREQALLELLKIINNGEMREIWAEDETIGWIYQYFNSKEEREAMRKASAAPRNSRELAVRNQFFTPRYVVEFLTDNTLGRVWYEMRQGDTRLKEECRYLVRRPNEIFLKQGEKAPEEGNQAEELTQEELIREPLYIPYRPKKDPRYLKILDPACGSGHFLLYCFDLLETVYAEAYEDSDLGPALIKDYSTLEVLRREVPGLILRHNLHGIEIDPRAVQIAALALWQRAQQSYHRLGLKPADRPRIGKTNIVCAEPMPGEVELLREFDSTLRPGVLEQIVEVVFEEMKLAGEAGSLLKIEEDIRETIAKAKKQWMAVPKNEQEVLFAELEKKKAIEGKFFDVRDVTDVEFWEQAEETIVGSLREYAERTDVGPTTQRRLFTEDSAQGFAFMDMCRKRFDVVLMNPPFGEISVGAKSIIKTAYPQTHKNLAATFVERAICLLEDRGYYGAILDVSTSIRSTYTDYRRQILYKRSQLTNYSHLGWGVLDANVEACCLTAYKPESTDHSNAVICYDVALAVSPKDELIACIDAANCGAAYSNLTLAYQEEFRHFPNAVPNFALPGELRRLFKNYSSLDPNFADVRTGLSSGDNERFYKLRWEVPANSIGREGGWLYLSNGGEFSPFYRPWQEVIDWRNEGRAIIELRLPNGKKKSRPQNLKYNLLPGITYGKRGKYLSVQTHPQKRVFTNEGQGIFPIGEKLRWYLLSVINSRLLRCLINEYCGQHKENGYVSLLPIREPDSSNLAELDKLAQEATSILRKQLMWSIEHAESLGIKLVDENKQRFRSLAHFISEAEREYANIAKELDKLDEKINELVFSLYEIYGLAREYVKERTKDMPSLGSVLAPNSRFREWKCHQVIDYILGCIFGRWDICYALDPITPSEIRDPFSPLTGSPPGLLDKKAGSQPNNIPTDYPLQIALNGTLVLDSSESKGFLLRIFDVFEMLFGDSDLVDREASEILGVKDIEDYFKNPNHFFENHLKLYSKSSRQAPIYWPVSTASGSYTLWIYYHRLTDQTLYACINDYLNPKLDNFFKEIERLRAEVAEGGTAQKRQRLEELMDFEQELKDFRDELLRVAQLPYKPNLNDGVMITAAPLWRLFRHNQWKKNLEACWKKLEGGDYDWAHLAYAIWPDRVKEKCKTDLSIAIAHGLEDVYEVEVVKPKKGRKTVAG